MDKVFKSNTWLLILDPEVVHQKINVELIWNIIIQVKYQESRIGCENLAYFQCIENNSKLSMTKIYLGKRQIGSIN